MGLSKTERRQRIKRRIRKVSFGTEQRPRLSVFRSNKDTLYLHIYRLIRSFTNISPFVN